MGRGKPFKASLSRLVAAGVVRKPIWMDVVEATKPPFRPVNSRKVPPIVYPEDRLRSIYLQRNPATRRIPVNLNATSATQRHISDQFVSIQMDLMEKRKMPEEEAYEEALRILENEKAAKRQFVEELLEGPLTNPSVKDETARLYLASLSDSRRDQRIYAALSDSGSPPPEQKAPE